MFEGFRYNIGKAYARYKFRAHNGEQIQFTGALSTARRVLLLLPENMATTAGVEVVLHHILQRYSPHHVTIVKRHGIMESAKPYPRARVVTFGAQDLTRWFLPRNELLQTVKKSTFDVAMDLNLDDALPSAFLCRSSDARIRIGFEKEDADTFYNVQVRVRRENPPSAYQRLINVVHML
jgi:hypothetical protein